MLRPALILLVLVSISIVPFALWGEDFEKLLSIDGTTEWMRGYGNWVWLIGIGLIASDIFLPIPATGIMAALGIIYSPIWGGITSAAGSIIAGLLGYGICRMINQKTIERLVGSKNTLQIRNLFETWGGWIVAASRWLPVLPETISFLAGLARMPFRKFFMALACGSIPMGFVFATVGHLGQDMPILTIVICALAPLILWFLVKPFLTPPEEKI